MEQCETIRDRDAEIKKMLEEKREARRQKLITRLGRNSNVPLSEASVEALTGTLRSKKAPGNSSAVKPKEEKKELILPKPDNLVKKSVPLKRTLSFGQTATSLKRTTIANGGAPIKRAISFKSIPTSAPKLVAPQAPQMARPQKSKLTIPYSPNFTNRSRQQPAIKPPLSTAKPVAGLVRKLHVTQTPKSLPAVRAVNHSGPVVSEITTKRKSSSWMVPLTPEQKVSSIKMTPPRSASSPRTPNVKPFIRKSFSESKTLPNRSTQLARSVSTATVALPSSTLSSNGTANSTQLKESRSSRSIWNVSKEPSEKEKVQQWLEKRGRSVASCRHLGCLGHQLKDFQVPERKASSARKSIRVYRPDITKSASPSASPQLKRVSVLNTTFEKEDNEEELVLTLPPPPTFQNEAEEEVDVAIGVESEKDQEEEIRDEFHTPLEKKQDSMLDLTDLQEGRVDKLLETISALFQEPIYPQAKIESWISQSEAAFPAVKTAALYWDIKARLEERRGNTMEALDIYSEALENKAEPLDTMKQLFDNFLLRIGSNMPSGQRTPLLKSLGVGTPAIRQSRRLTNLRRPLHDSSQTFNSTTVKYELKLEKVFDSVGAQKLKENATPREKIKTPIMKFNAESKTISITNEGAYELVATPVRRSMRPKSTRQVSKLAENVLYVDDLDQLSPTTKSKAVIRKNVALSSDYQV